MASFHNLGCYNDPYLAALKLVVEMVVVWGVAMPVLNMDAAAMLQDSSGLVCVTSSLSGSVGAACVCVELIAPGADSGAVLGQVGLELTPCIARLPTRIAFHLPLYCYLDLFLKEGSN